MTLLVGAQQVPAISKGVAEHLNCTVRLVARRTDQFHAVSFQARARHLEVVHTKEESDSATSLVPHPRRLSLAVGSGQQQTGSMPWRTDDDPTLRFTLLIDRWAVLDQFESEHSLEEPDRLVVLRYDEGDQIDVHRCTVERHRSRYKRC